MIVKDVAMPSPLDLVEDNYGILILVAVVVVAAIIGLKLIKKARKKN